MILIMVELSFHCEKRISTRLKQKNSTCINLYCYKIKLAFPIYISHQKFENSMDLLLVTDENRSHYVYIKDFDKFMFHKTKNKNKKYFCKSCLQCFSSKNVLTEHKENCLSINVAQSVTSEKGKIKFNYYFKKIPVPFKIYADFECKLQIVGSYKGSYSKTIKIAFLVVLLTNLLVLMIDIVSRLLFLEVRMLLVNLLKQFLKSLNTARK